MIGYLSIEASWKMTSHQQSFTWHGFDTTSIKHWIGRGLNPQPSDRELSALPRQSFCSLV